MTALNITTNDLTDPTAETRRRVEAYNDNVGTTLDQVMGQNDDVVEGKTKTLVDYLGVTVVSNDNIPDWAHEEEPANDNEPQQLDLFDDASGE
jgi:hypothetical protein